MARFRKGILGGFTGTIGTVIGGNWKGIDYMRSLPNIRNTEPTLKQDLQRRKFRLVANFLRTMKPLLMISFKDSGMKMTGHNSAFSYTLKNAVAGVYPDFELDYTLVKIARGNLPNAVLTGADSTDPGKIKFTWNDNTGIGAAKATDKAILVAYHADTQTAAFTIADAFRSGTVGELSVAALRGKQVETWLAFISEDDKDVSSSVHTGKITAA